MKMLIRPFRKQDWPQVWEILCPIFRSGETYAIPRDVSEKEAYAIWNAPSNIVFCAEDPSNQAVVGSYYLKPNYAGAASHICNCGYAVPADARGKGIATLMCRHSLVEAVSEGFKGMQFNLVASSNESAVRLWLKMGFAVIGTLPASFRHPRLGYVDSFIMYRLLDEAT
jgi:RimJ/RimL family protein N-acetyltransferase